jgi:hypothetical protein
MRTFAELQDAVSISGMPDTDPSQAVKLIKGVCAYLGDPESGLTEDQKSDLRIGIYDARKKAAYHFSQRCSAA